MTTTTAAVITTTPRWLTVGLLLPIGLFNVFASVTDFIATTNTGLPGDHTGTFAKLSGTSWATFQHAHPGPASYITLLERGGLRATRDDVRHLVPGHPGDPVPRRQRWTCWTARLALRRQRGPAESSFVPCPALRVRGVTRELGTWGVRWRLIVAACRGGGWRERSERQGSDRGFKVGGHGRCADPAGGQHG